jgi:hypothetical protein
MNLKNLRNKLLILTVVLVSIGSGYAQTLLLRPGKQSYITTNPDSPVVARSLNVVDNSSLGLTQDFLNIPAAETYTSRETTIGPATKFYFSSTNGLEGVSFKVKLTDGSFTEQKEISLNDDLVVEYDPNTPIVSEMYEIENFGEIELVNPENKSVEIKFIANRIENISFQSAGYYDEIYSYETEYTNRFFKGMGLDIYTREEWGAPSYSLWEPEISPIDKIVIHHTAINVNSADPAQSVRDIYNYHKYLCGNNNGSYPTNCTIENTWQDIGYNYLIDPYGNIYEGRTGDNGTIGAHAYLSNYGSIGIAIMGNYSYIEPSAASLNSLKHLLASLSVANQISLIWQGTVFGHRDRPNNSTACPGQKFYEMLPGILSEASGLTSIKTNIINAVNKTNALMNVEYELLPTNQVHLLLSKDGIESAILPKFLTISRGANDVREDDRMIISAVGENLVKQFITQTLLTIPSAQITPNYLYSTP